MARPFRQRRGIRVGLGAVAVLLALAVAAPSAQAAPSGRATARQAPSEAENYVQWVYESLLFRSADSGGLAYWTALVEAHGPGPFVHYVVTSDEWRGVWVNAFYESIWLDRPADDGALAYWKNYLAANHGFDGFEAALGGSDEGYQLSGGTDLDYIDYVYNAAAFREPTAEEREDALEALATGSTTEFVGSVLLSADGLGSRVEIAYERTLARPAHPGGLAYWSTYFRQTGSMSQMLAAQILSAEAWETAQDPVVGPTELRSLVKR